MHRTVGTVFKVLGISIILMVIMDAVFVIADTIVVNNRIEALAVVMQDELSRNNAIPNDSATLFDNQLREVIENSNIATEINWNLNSAVTAESSTYPPINEANVKDYGELLTLAITVKMEPRSMMFFQNTSANDGSFLGTSIIEYTSEYIYKVPALRYLK